MNHPEADTESVLRVAKAAAAMISSWNYLRAMAADWVNVCRIKWWTTTTYRYSKNTSSQSKSAHT